MAPINNNKFFSMSLNINEVFTTVSALEKVDPKIMEHLKKLQRIAETNPEQFKTFCTMLDFYN